MFNGRARIVLVAAAGLIVPALLIVLALPRIVEGIGIERALPVVRSATVGQTLSLDRYRGAADDLTSTMPENGDGLVRLAEMMALAANNEPRGLSRARAMVVRGLALAPLNPRGWTLLCEIDSHVVKADAPRCMDTGFFVAPFDWFVAGRRALLAAALWPTLDADVRNAAARRVRLMWEADHWWFDHRVKLVLYDVYRAPNGAALLNAGFQDDPDELRSFNRWLIQQQMNNASP